VGGGKAGGGKAGGCKAGGCKAGGCILGTSIFDSTATNAGAALPIVERILSADDTDASRSINSTILIMSLGVIQLTLTTDTPTS